MKTSMSIIIFFVAFLSISSISSIPLAKNPVVFYRTKDPVETCIKRNIAKSFPPPPSTNTKISDAENIIIDSFCRDELRTVMYFLKANQRFPVYYVEALCDIFGWDEEKVKQYVIKNWLHHSKKLLNGLKCTFSIKK
ncbi:hypothetical protein V5N11_003302 [Cardamine amara subsp. amara]|uniref:Uncharacterized protein n=1 Tax=Cardamine amara subsp. amara TaxID=228776 RepID=A0ABD1BTQ4_CARAN